MGRRQTLARGMFCIHQQISDQQAWNTFETDLGESVTFESAYAYDALHLIAQGITELLAQGNTIDDVVQNLHSLRLELSGANFSSVFHPSSAATLETQTGSPIVDVTVNNFESTSGMWRVVGTSTNTNSEELVVDHSLLQFSDLSSIVPSSYSRIVVGVLVADEIIPSNGQQIGFLHARGAEVRPAVKAAQLYIRDNSDSILTGYNFTTVFGTTGCNAGHAMVAYSSLMASDPIAVIGGDCDLSTSVLQTVAAASQRVRHASLPRPPLPVALFCASRYF